MGKKVGRPSSGKGKLITIRLTPKMRYSVELIARIQRRTSITAVVEFAIEKILRDDATGLLDANTGFLPDLIWDEDETTRFIKLCLLRPDLLTYDEGLIWRVIESGESYWRGFRVPNYEKIKEDWNAINVTAKLA
jgi:hypothetical protein